MFQFLIKNTLQVAARAKNLIELTDVEQLKNISGEILFLGHGANILFTKDFDGTVIHINLKGKKIISENDDAVVVEIAAGENWHEFVTWAVENDYSGIENMALIPGTVGAAVVGNIAAYGQNQEDVFVSAQCSVLSTQKTEIFNKSDCQFKYRESVFKSNPDLLITSVRYKLSKHANVNTSYHTTRHASLLPTLQQIAAEPYTIRNVYDAVVKMRMEKIPDWHKVGTAGSFFKNPIITKEKFAEMSKKIPDLLAYPIDKLQYVDPSDQDKFVKVSIARALDELGWKGKTIGRVSTGLNQALYVINLGGATGQEIFDYAEMMREDIKKNFDIDLEYEVRII